MVTALTTEEELEDETMVAVVKKFSDEGAAGMCSGYMYTLAGFTLMS